MNKYSIGIITFLFALFIVAMSYADVNSLLSKKGKEISLSADDGTLFKIRIQATKAPVNFLYDDGWRWGAEKSPKYIIRKIEAWWGDEKVFIPLSAYFDLTNPHEVFLKKAGNQFHLTIKGGDAATSYEALLIFEKGNLLSKKVFSGEFPDEAWEETKYSFNELDN
jgi:hypothetical protein